MYTQTATSIVWIRVLNDTLLDLLESFQGKGRWGSQNALMCIALDLPCIRSPDSHKEAVLLGTLISVNKNDSKALIFKFNVFLTSFTIKQ